MKVTTPGPEWDEAYKVAYDDAVGNHFTHFHESIDSRCTGFEQRFFVFLDIKIVKLPPQAKPGS